ncbi:MAG: HpcH/HpaI aldolase/citrate lyase family protein [Pseudomonadota bacterium]
MQTPINTFKQALQQKRPQIGLWAALADPYCAEVIACTGYDWLLIDGEHAPNDLRSVLGQLQGIASAVSAFPDRPGMSHPVVRVPHGDAALIKQFLDIGAQTLLVPMVNTAEQAAALVQAMRYPPQGIRGLGSSLARAARWATYPNYLHEANDQVCLLVQVESVEAMQNIDAIAATPGVDGVFIGPSDLAATMGHPGNTAHPDVQAAIEHGMKRILLAGKAPGILSPTEPQARKWLYAGAVFVAVGMDVTLMVTGAKALLAKYKTPGATASAGGGY